jgi:hypothetical protein
MQIANTDSGKSPPHLPPCTQSYFQVYLEFSDICEHHHHPLPQFGSDHLRARFALGVSHGKYREGSFPSHLQSSGQLPIVSDQVGVEEISVNRSLNQKDRKSRRMLATSPGLVIALRKRPVKACKPTTAARVQR